MADAHDFVRHYTEDFINAHNLAAIDELFAPTIVFQDPVAPGGVLHGIEELRQFISALFAGMPDLHFEADNVLGGGDLIGWHGTLHGTHQGELAGVPATGKAVTAPLAEFYHLADGKIVEEWVFTDPLSILQQIGAIPTSGQPTT